MHPCFLSRMSLPPGMVYFMQNCTSGYSQHAGGLAGASYIEKKLNTFIRHICWIQKNVILRERERAMVRSPLSVSGEERNLRGLLIH